MKTTWQTTQERLPEQKFTSGRRRRRCRRRRRKILHSLVLKFSIFAFEVRERNP